VTVPRTPEDIANITDPAERARAAGELLSEHQTAVARLARIRRRAVAELRADGLSYAEVGQKLGLTRGRIAQLKSSTIEEQFFGGSHVTIATPLRRTTAGRPLVAQEDVEAAMVLTRFLDAADVATNLQHVSTAGELDLSPAALVAICGPKSSPVVEQLIAADPWFQFSADAKGRWRIIERSSGHTYASPLDDDPDADRDVAYIARLPRPDGTTSVLVIAGVHAIGSLGAVHYLTTMTNLRELHHTVAGQAFSMVVESQFQRSPLRAVAAEAKTDPKIHALHQQYG
jgi:hypothetical protein